MSDRRSGSDVNTLQKLLERDIPLVAVSFRDEDSERLAREASAAGVDVAELRIDQFSHTGRDHVLEQVRTFRALPVLATIRSRKEGGDWNGSEAERLDLFNAVVTEVDAVDIELSSTEIRSEVIAAAKRHGRVVVVSHHDFDSTPSPDTLEKLVKDGKNLGADIVKISTMARSKRDLRTLASLTITMAELGVVVIAMGAVGTLGRIFFPALGSRLTYSFLGESRAPGQLEFTETFRLMRKFYPDFDEQKKMSTQLRDDG